MVKSLIRHSLFQLAPSAMGAPVLQGGALIYRLKKAGGGGGGGGSNLIGALIFYDTGRLYRALRVCWNLKWRFV